MLALYDFMPYGAPELIEGAPRRMFRATASSMGFWIVAFLTVLGWLLIHPPAVLVPPTVIVNYRELAAPPPLSSVTAPPQVVVGRAAVTPAMGLPVPVPDMAAPPEQTIASQEEIAAASGAGEATGQQGIVVVQPPAAEDMPKLGDYVYADELPVLIKEVLPKYPDIAREAQSEGEVLVRVLIGKDGHVVEVHVDKSVPMFDDAAVEAAKQWVFKPAFAGNHPVAVWIARKVRFALTTP